MKKFIILLSFSMLLLSSLFDFGLTTEATTTTTILCGGAVTDDNNNIPDEYKILANQLLAMLSNRNDKDSTNNNNNNTIVLSTSTDSSQVRTQSYKKQYNKLNVNNLNKILCIDNDTVTVQTRCTYDTLVKELLLRHNNNKMIPAVVPEFKSITIGGAIIGSSLESTSFIYGQVSDTIISATVLLGNGTIVTNVTSDNNYSDLYNALPGSYGTLGILLDATIQLVPIPSSIVQIKLLKFNTIQDGINALIQLLITNNKSTSNNIKFLDALQFPSGEIVLIIGSYYNSSTTCPLPKITRLGHDTLWLYEQIQDRMKHLQYSDLNDITTLNDINVMSSCTDEIVSKQKQQQYSILYMNIYDYLFRYEYGAFWMARPMQFKWKTILRNPILIGPFITSWRKTRILFGKLFTTTKLYRLLHKVDSTAVAEKFIIIDMYTPASNVTKLLTYIRENIPITVPIWLCPVKPPLQSQPLSPSGGSNNTNLLINVAVWGRVIDNNAIRYVYLLEEKMLQLGGRKMLYSQTNMSINDLYIKHIDGISYDKLRTVYNADTIFPKLHEKLQIYNNNNNNKKRRRGFKYWLSRILL